MPFLSRLFLGAATYLLGELGSRIAKSLQLQSNRIAQLLPHYYTVSMAKSQVCLGGWNDCASDGDSLGMPPLWWKAAQNGLR